MNAINDFQKEILAGIPDELPEVKPYDTTINHAPKRKDTRLRLFSLRPIMK